MNLQTQRRWNSTFRIKVKEEKNSVSRHHGIAAKRGLGIRSLAIVKPMRLKRLTRVDSEARIKQDLTTLTSLIVRMRDGYCVICGSNRELQNGHFFHRDMPPTEFCLINCNALCKRCNVRHEYRPEEYTAWVKQKLGVEGFAELERRAHAQTKLGYIELWDLRERYKLAVKEARAA